MSTIKTAYNILEHLLDNFHLIKNARYNSQESGIGGLVVSMLASGSNPAETVYALPTN
jgi:hypothetical protein